MYKRSEEILWDKYPKLYQDKKYLQCSLDFIKKLNEDLILLSHPCLHNSLISLITCINIYAWHRMVFRYIYYVFSLCLSLSLFPSLSLVCGPTIKAGDIYYRWAKWKIWTENVLARTKLLLFSLFPYVIPLQFLYFPCMFPMTQK